ncbi:unnamed protein product [Amoebophrya sp. A120]|nr:unnamed protein product [Amoebophrya sp. A120]|eukprot:GSA120T00007182001.1
MSTASVDRNPSGPFLSWFAGTEKDITALQEMQQQVDQGPTGTSTTASEDHGVDFMSQTISTTTTVTAPNNTGLRIFQLIVAIVIFVLSMGSAIFRVRYATKVCKQSIIDLCNVCAAGMFLGMAFNHLLPEAMELAPELKNPKLNIVGVGGFAGYMLILFCERVIGSLGKTQESEHQKLKQRITSKSVLCDCEYGEDDNAARYHGHGHGDFSLTNMEQNNGYPCAAVSNEDPEYNCPAGGGANEGGLAMQPTASTTGVVSTTSCTDKNCTVDSTVSVLKNNSCSKTPSLPLLTEDQNAVKVEAPGDELQLCTDQDCPDINATKCTGDENCPELLENKNDPRRISVSEVDCRDVTGPAKVAGTTNTNSKTSPACAGSSTSSGASGSSSGKSSCDHEDCAGGPSSSTSQPSHGHGHGTAIAYGSSATPLPPSSHHHNRHSHSSDHHDSEDHHQHDYGKSMKKGGKGAYIMMLALSVHSVFEGIVIGIARNFRTAAMVSLCVVAHKWAAAFAIGTAFATANVQPESKIYKFVSIFAISSPVGILIGILISEIALDSLQGCTNAIAAGTLLYISMSEVIPEEFVLTTQPLLRFFSLCLGYSVIVGVQMLDTD